MEFNGLTFHITCHAFPEQYDVYDKDNQKVGYVRLRWGCVTCEVPDVFGEIIYSASVGDGWTGMFENDEQRNFHLRSIANAIIGNMKDDDYTIPLSAHRLELTGRERLTVSGVEDVERFDENMIVMSTSAGTLVISGEGLHIGKLTLDGGELHVDGRVDAMSYEETVRGGGLFGRLFG